MTKPTSKEVQSVCEFTGLSAATVQRLSEFNFAEVVCLSPHKFFREYGIMPWEARRCVGVIDKLLSRNGFFVDTIRYVNAYLENAQKAIELSNELAGLQNAIDAQTADNQDIAVDFSDDSWFVQKLAATLERNDASGKVSLFDSQAELEDKLAKVLKERDVNLYYAEELFAENVQAITDLECP